MKFGLFLMALSLTTVMLTGCTPKEAVLSDSRLPEGGAAASESVMFVVTQSPSWGFGQRNCTVLEQDGELYRALDAEIQLYSQEFWEGYDNGDYSSVFTLVGEAGEEYAENYRIAAEEIRNGRHELLYPEVTPAVEDYYLCTFSAVVDGELIPLYSYGDCSGTQSYSSSDEIMEVCAWLREEIKVK